MTGARQCRPLSRAALDRRLDLRRAARSGCVTAGIARPMGGFMPKLNAPTQVMFLVSLVIVLLAVIGLFINIPVISMYAFWVAILGYAVLAAGCVLKGT